VEPERARELLAAERQRIETALAGLRPAESGELTELDQHPADAGTETFEEERDAGIAESLEEELAAVARAEQRLEEGTYGRSIESGEPIPDARLEAVPWAERTAEEQSRIEGRA
jgi:DnaK suppressor protein